MIEKKLQDLIKEYTDTIHWFGIHHFKRGVNYSRSELFGKTFDKDSVWSKIASEIYQNLPLTLFRFILFDPAFAMNEKTVIVKKKFNKKLILSFKETTDNVIIEFNYLGEKKSLFSKWNDIENNKRFDDNDLSFLIKTFLYGSFSSPSSTDIRYIIENFINSDNPQVITINQTSININLNQYKLLTLFIGTLLWPWEILIYDKIQEEQKIVRVGFVQSVKKNLYHYLNSATYLRIYYEGLNYIWAEEKELKLIEEKLKKEAQLKTAIISILIDSYAHNISAHSLAALKWWIELRHKMLDKRFIVKNGAELNCLQPSNIIFNKDKSKNECKNSSLTKIDNFKDTTLKYYEALGLKDSTYNEEYYSLFDFLQFAEKETIKQLFQFSTLVHQKDGKDFHPRFPVPIDYALYPFFRFLRDKGAFWSGVTRDIAFGGESKTWFKILWEDFANNPLYLGTVAKSEGITKININLDVNIDGKKHKGRFVTIDMSVIDYEEKVSQDPTLHAGKYADLLKNDIKEDENCRSCKDYVEYDQYSKYAFVKLGKCFAEFRKILDNEEDCRVFLPGGIVGEHALFTIFENTIRNIKHYKESLDDIKKNGIDFWISIEEDKLWITKQNEKIKQPEGEDAKGKKPELFKVGVWLGHEMELVKAVSVNAELKNGKGNLKGKFVVQERKEKNVKGKFTPDDKNDTQNEINSEFTIEEDESNYFLKKDKIKIIVSKTEKLEPLYPLVQITDQTLKPILNESTGAPRMGGNSQDKACAAMLFNNKFSSVERKETERDKQYFPWVEFKTLNSKNREAKGVKLDWNGSEKIINSDSKNEYTNNISKDDKGYLKKYFYLWQGEDVLDKSALEADDWENPARARFLVNSEEWTTEDMIKARKQGLIRIISKVNKPQNQNELNKLYIKWLDIWLKNNKNYKIILFSNKDPRLHIYYENDYIKFEPQNNQKQNFTKHLYLSHGDEKSYNCNVRSHGVFWTKIFNCSKLNTDPDKLCIFKSACYDKLDDEQKKKIDALILEFWETVLTKIVIFDNRIHQRIPKSYENATDTNISKVKMLNEYLSLFIFDENEETFNQQISNHKDVNFLIMHLSFIENIKDNSGNKYSEDRLNDFIYEKLKDVIFVNEAGIEKLREDFILVITSGRGRDRWRESLKGKNICFEKFTIFKPVESLLSAVENGISYNDHFDLKYYLTKVLLGN